MADDLDAGNEAPQPEEAPPAASAATPSQGAEPGGAQGRPWGSFLVLWALLAVLLTVLGVVAETWKTPQQFPLGAGLLLWGLLDLVAQRRGLVVWKGPKAVVGNAVNLLRACALLGLGVWLLLVALGAARPVNPAVVTWIAASGLAAYLAAALLIEILVKGIRLRAQPMLLASLALMFVSYYYFAIPFTYSWSAVFACLSFGAAAWSVHAGVLSESRDLGRAVLAAVLLLGAPMGIYTFQQAFMVEEQPLFTPTLLIPRMRQVVGGLSEDASQIRWAPVHTQSGQPGDVRYSDKVAFMDWDKDQEVVKLFQQHEDGLREILRLDAAGEANLSSFSSDGRKLSLTGLKRTGASQDLHVLQPQPPADAEAAMQALANGASELPVPENPAQRRERAKQAREDAASAEPGRLAYGQSTVFGAGADPGPEHGQVWRDMGRQLYFAAPGGGPRNLASAIMRADLDTDKVETLREGRSYPAVSPDGKALLSVGFFPNRKVLQIADGLAEHNPRLFDPAKERHYFPAWNAAQTRVLFFDAKTQKLMIMHSNGRDHELFTPALLESKVWFSDKLAPFTLQVRETGDIFRVYRSLPNGKKEQLIYEAPGRGISPPQWSADGSRVAFIVHGDVDSEVITVGPDGSWPRHFFTTKDELDELKWSPDGRKVAWICRRAEDNTQEVWTAVEQGLEPERVLVDGGELQNLTWSPAGKHLAVQETRAWSLFGLRLVRPDLHNVLMISLTDRKARVMTRYGIMSRDPAFSPQGVAIAYFTDQRPWSLRPLRERTSALVVSQLY